MRVIRRMEMEMEQITGKVIVILYVNFFLLIQSIH